MTPSPLLLAVLWLPAAAPAAPPPDDCEHVAERSARVPAADAALVRVAAAAGSLRVVGRPGLDEVRVRGQACSSDRRLLEQIQLVAERAGSEIRVEARMPETRGPGFAQSRLDLVIEVPEALAVDVRDSSGDTEIHDVAAARVQDGSGEIRIERVRGEVRVDDGSGNVYVAGVGGDVLLTDSSGGMEVRDVQGSVLVEEDSSGDIEIADVRRHVLVRRDSSGGIGVARVGGDFRVDRDGSGGIRYREVAGTVRVPDR